MRAIITLMVFHLSIVFAINPAVSNDVKGEKKNNDQVIPTKVTWKEKAIEVLEEIVSEPIDAPPTKPEYTHSYWSSIPVDPKWDYGLMWWYIEKANNLSAQVNLTRNHAKNILYLIKRNETALWETSTKSAIDARHLAEEAASFTKDLIRNLSEEKKKKAVATIKSHIKVQTGSNIWKISQFRRARKITDEVLRTALKGRVLELEHLESELRSFRNRSDEKVNSVRRSAEVSVNQTIKYLNLAENTSTKGAQWIFAQHEKVALNQLKIACDEAIRHARKDQKEARTNVQKMFDSFEETCGKTKDKILGTLKETKSAHEETIKSQTKIIQDAIGISITFFKSTEIQSVLERAKSAIDKSRIDIDRSKWDAREEFERMSESVDEVIKKGSYLRKFTNRGTWLAELGMYGTQAQSYGQRVKRRLLRLKNYISKINQVSILTEENFKGGVRKWNENLEEAVRKWNEVMKDERHVANISTAAVEEATREIKQKADLVQAMFDTTEAKAKSLIEKYSDQCFVKLREAEEILSETNSAVDDAAKKIRLTEKRLTFKVNVQIIKERTKLFFIGIVILTVMCLIVKFSIVVGNKLHRCPHDYLANVRLRTEDYLQRLSDREIVFGKKLLRGPHAYLSEIRTEDDLQRLSERKMKEVLEMCGIEIKEEASQEELLELLKQLWLHGERSPALAENKYVADDEASKCKVCMDADIDCVILDCGHLVSCNQCGKKLTECPICRQQVLEVLSVANVTEQDMMKLTTKQIKQVLNLCGVGFKDRVFARRRVEESAMLEKEQKCKVCMEKVVDCVFINCGHLMTCTCCGEKLDRCPICQKRIARVAKIYRT